MEETPRIGGPRAGAEMVDRLVGMEPLISSFADVQIPDLPIVPGMITPAEDRYLYWLGSRVYSGAGAVVEVGSWLGRSTIHLAAGLHDAGFDDALSCFDKFEWGPFYATKADLPLEPGGDFQVYFERNVRPVYPNLRVEKRTFEDMSWTEQPIEILFLDAPKKLEDISSVMATFSRALIPNRSIVVLQDYLHAPSYALASVLSRLSSCLSLVHVVEGGTTVAFLVRKPLLCHFHQATSWNYLRWPVEETLRTWQLILDPLPQSSRDLINPGLAFILYDQGRVGDALDAIRRMRYDDRAMRRHFATAHLYARYEAIFRAAGMVKKEGSLQRLLSMKRRIRKALNRRWSLAGRSR